jgi:dienelactone hydrolase
MPPRRLPAFPICAIAIASALVLCAHAAPPRLLKEGQLPNDRRLEPLKDLDGYFPFTPPASPEAWRERAEHVRRQILVTLGLWPMPAPVPLNAVIHGRVDQGDYTVEKVYFQSAPGFYVTGNLYRPKNPDGERRPGVLCPHGHWSNGRFLDQGTNTVRREISIGAERFEDGGRSVLQARCVTLARMGCVVFHYDMLGYADSQQLSMALVHGFARQRPEMNDPEAWGLFSPQAEARFQSAMGLQTLNSIRALDFLESLPDVDPKRIAVTGASGGGTQTFILGAIDPRPAVVFPAVMVSTAMQGGCTCENACGLRVGTGNVEFAALFAPKPQGLTSANDWTLEMPTKGFPDLQRVYEMLGAKDRVALTHLPHFGHNYNYVSRSAMYQFLNKHLGLGLPEPVIEEDYPRLTADQLSVWNDQHPRPPGGDAFERELLQWWTRDATDQLSRASASAEARKKTIQPAIEITLGRSLKDVGPVEWQIEVKNDHGDFLEMAGWLRATRHGESLPVVFLHPKNGDGATTVIVPTPQGKAGLYTAEGQIRPDIRQRLSRGETVAGVDLIHQGEFLADGKPLEKTRRVKNPREAAARPRSADDRPLPQGPRAGPAKHPIRRGRRRRALGPLRRRGRRWRRGHFGSCAHLVPFRERPGHSQPRLHPRRREVPRPLRPSTLKRALRAARRRQERLERARLAARRAGPAVVLAHDHQLGVEILPQIQRIIVRPEREPVHADALEPVVIGARRTPAMAAEYPRRVRVHDKAQMPARVEQHAVSGLRTHARDSQEPLPRFSDAPGEQPAQPALTFLRQRPQETPKPARLDVVIARRTDEVRQLRLRQRGHRRGRHHPRLFQARDRALHIRPRGVLSENRPDADFERALRRPPVKMPVPGQHRVIRLAQRRRHDSVSVRWKRRVAMNV